MKFCSRLGVCGLLFLLAPMAVAAPNPKDAAEEVDELLAADIGAKPADKTPICDDETYLRRVFLDLVGKPPTQADILAFCLDQDSEKRRAVVDRLLADPDFGVNWGKYWRDVVMYRRTEDRALIVAGMFQDFLTKQFNDNKSWSDTASQIITAVGDATENGDTGLIIAQAGMPEDVTSEVSRIFLGIQIQCAQCHDHPTDRWKREQFHEMAAFFPRIAARLNLQDRTMIVSATDFEPRRRPVNAMNRFIGTLEHHMPDKNDPSSKGTEMQPVFFLTGQKVATGTRDYDRRATLARWITSIENPWFAKAYVNRIWAELVGQGFYEPIDDIGPDRTCSAPKTIDYLAKTFADADYDVKWFYRTVTATQAYQRESRSRHITGDGPFLASCAQRLRSEQLLDSLISVLNLEGKLPEALAGGGPMNLRRDTRFLFNQVFGYDPSEPREEVAASIPQALMMMNSPIIHQGVSARRRDALGGILENNKKDDAALVEVYLNTLGRAPTEKETNTCLTYLKQVGDRNEAFEDIQWSLINSTEFTFRK